MATRKIKRFKTFIKDLVFNNPRADRQMPIGGTASQEVLDNKMLYDKKDEWNSTRSPKHLTIRRGKTKIANVPNLQSLALALEIENALSFAVENKKNLIWKNAEKVACKPHRILANLTYDNGLHTLYLTLQITIIQTANVNTLRWKFGRYGYDTCGRQESRNSLLETTFGVFTSVF